MTYCVDLLRVCDVKRESGWFAKCVIRVWQPYKYSRVPNSSIEYRYVYLFYGKIYNYTFLLGPIRLVFFIQFIHLHRLITYYFSLIFMLIQSYIGTYIWHPRVVIQVWKVRQGRLASTQKVLSYFFCHNSALRREYQDSGGKSL